MEVRRPEVILAGGVSPSPVIGVPSVGVKVKGAPRSPLQLEISMQFFPSPLYYYRIYESRK
jgi:hypothetical protein